MSEKRRIEITDWQLSEDLNTLSETDDTAAEAKVEELRSKYLMERTEYIEKLGAVGTVAEREAKAKTSQKYMKAEETYLTAMTNNEKLKAKRASAAIRIEVWRSKNANRRTGNI